MKNQKSRLLSLIAVTFVAYQAPDSLALDGTWDKTKTNTNWGSNGNWVNSQQANGSGFTATFNAAATSITVNLNTNRSIGNILVTDVTSTTNAITISGANTLTLTGAAIPVFDIAGTADAGLSIGATTILAGTQGLEKTGAGLLTFLGAASTFTGDIILSEGGIRSYVANALGSRNIVINGADTQWRVEAGEHQSNLILKGGDATIGGVGPATGGGTADSRLSGIISETGLTPRGVSYFNSANGANRVKRLIVSGSNSYTGDTTVGRNAASETILRITHANALGTGTANVGIVAGSNHDANTLELSSSITVADKKLTLAGRGQDQLGSLYNVDGVNVWQGEVALGALDNPTIGTATGSQLTISGLVTGAAAGASGFIKEGGGTLILSANNTYTGATLVKNGTLTVNGTHTGDGAFTVNSGATLNGRGSVNGTVTILGNLSAGTTESAFATGSLTIESTGTLRVDLARDEGTAVSGRVNVTGSVSLLNGANLTLNLAGGLENPANGDIFWIVNNDSTDAVSGMFTHLNGAATNLSEGSFFSWNSQSWQITYLADFDNLSILGGNDIALIAVPEPHWAGSVILLLGALLWKKRRIASGSCL